MESGKDIDIKGSKAGGKKVEIKKNIIRYCKSEMKEDVIEKLRKKEFRFYLGMACLGTIIFMGVLIYFLPI